MGIPCNNMNRQIYLSFKYVVNTYRTCIDIYSCNSGTAGKPNGVNCTLVEPSIHASDFNHLIMPNGKMTRVQSMHSNDFEWNQIRPFLSDFREYSSFVSGMMRASFVYQSFVKCNVYWSAPRSRFNPLTQYGLLTLHCTWDWLIIGSVWSLVAQPIEEPMLVDAKCFSVMLLPESILLHCWV